MSAENVDGGDASAHCVLVVLVGLVSTFPFSGISHLMLSSVWFCALWFARRAGVKLFEF